MPVRDIHSIPNIPDLFKAILEEACELAVKANSDLPLKETAYHSFLICINLVKGLLEAQLKIADSITFNYRDRSFLIDRNHPILKFSTPH